MGDPQNGWFIGENPMKMDTLGGSLISGNHHILSYTMMVKHSHRTAICFSGESLGGSLRLLLHQGCGFQDHETPKKKEWQLNKSINTYNEEEKTAGPH